jgi:hypothetical protein
MMAFLKKVGMRFLRFLCGFNLIDQRTGKVIGRVVLVRWKGGLRLIGLEGVALRPHFLPQEKERYWAQDLGFSTHAPPDFPKVADAAGDGASGCLNVSGKVIESGE